MKTLPGYYTTAEAAKALGLTKPGTAKAARVEGWPVHQVGNVHLYAAEDVLEYRDHRRRTGLVKALGWRGRGLYRNDGIDFECPVCGEFAVEWPALPCLPEKYRCLKGHEGKL